MCDIPPDPINYLCSLSSNQISGNHATSRSKLNKIFNQMLQDLILRALCEGLFPQKSHIWWGFFLQKSPVMRALIYGSFAERALHTGIWRSDCSKIWSSTKLCSTSVITQHGWVIHFRQTKMVRRKRFVPLRYQVPKRKSAGLALKYFYIVRSVGQIRAPWPVLRASCRDVGGWGRYPHCWYPFFAFSVSNPFLGSILTK